MNKLLCIALASLLAAGWTVGASAASMSKATTFVRMSQGADNPPGDNRHGRGTDNAAPKRQGTGTFVQKSQGADNPPGDNRGGHGGDDGSRHR